MLKFINTVETRNLEVPGTKMTPTKFRVVRLCMSCLLCFLIKIARSRIMRTKRGLKTHICFRLKCIKRFMVNKVLMNKMSQLDNAIKLTNKLKFRPF